MLDDCAIAKKVRATLAQPAVSHAHAVKVEHDIAVRKGSGKVVPLLVGEIARMR
jgi:hypothetical protein